MKEVVEKFYESLGKLDGEGMVSCYHNDVSFEDPAFGLLVGERAKNMWRMLCKAQKGKEFNLSVISIKETFIGFASEVEVDYTFGKSQRKVHNKIRGEFVFKDGKIIQHSDVFDFRIWAKQAIGISGYLFGNRPFFRKKLRKQLNLFLDKFEAKN